MRSTSYNHRKLLVNAKNRDIVTIKCSLKGYGTKN
jgi:hypothetical protein